MTQYKFVPNAAAKEFFNLAADYTADGMTTVLEQALGADNYSKYVFAQDPLCGNKSSGDIRIVLNRDELKPDLSNITSLRYTSIGTIYKIG